jgi:tetratricopeptide (TPR) repeat protein
MQPPSRFALTLVALALSGVASSASADLPAREEILEIERALALHPHDVRLVIAHAERSIEAGDAERALEDLSLAAALAPHEPTVAAVRAEALVSIERFDDALAELERARAGGFAGPRALALRARILSRQGRLTEAVEAWDEVVSLSPDPDAYLERGALLARLGREREALANDREGLEITGSTALRLALVDRAEALGEHEVALEAIAPLIEPRAGATRGRWLLRAAEILREAGREAEATARFEEAERELALRTRRRPSAAALVDHARALEGLGRLDEAERQARRALALHTPSADAQALLRRLERARGAR